MYNVRSYQKPRCFEKCTFFFVWRMLHPCVRRMTWDKPLNNFSECFFMMTSCSSTFFSISNLHIHERRRGGGGGSSWKCKCWINLHIWLFYAIPKKVSMYFCLLIRVKLPFGFRDLKYLSRIEDYAMKCLLILCKWSCEIFLMLIDVEEMDPQNSLSVGILA